MVKATSVLADSQVLSGLLDTWTFKPHANHDLINVWGQIRVNNILNFHFECSQMIKVFVDVYV